MIFVPSMDVIGYFTNNKQLSNFIFRSFDLQCGLLLKAKYDYIPVKSEVVANSWTSLIQGIFKLYIMSGHDRCTDCTI